MRGSLPSNTGQIFPLGTSLVVVVFTAAVAAWLITTRNDRFGYGVIAIVFGLFCGYSVFKMAGGAASCGCFGLIHTSPLLMAGGDGLIAASAALLTRNAGRPAALMYVKTAMFVAGVIVITFAFAEGTVVSLSPTKGGSEWIRSVETVESFDGSWELVVVWHGCDKCSRFIDSLGPKGKFRRMLVEMEPYADDPATLIEQSHADAYGRLPLSSGLPLTFAPSRTLVRDATIIH